MIIEARSLEEYVEHHGLDYNYRLIEHNDYHITSEYVNGEYWYNVFYDDGVMMSDYIYSSRDIRDCLDYCEILYYEGPGYR